MNEIEVKQREFFERQLEQINRELQELEEEIDCDLDHELGEVNVFAKGTNIHKRIHRDE
ncbi:MAG: hypothetical protein KGZ39_05725 [Simkania sp.]|nr:hypothetical protein [Simkania sp.]